MRYIAFIFLLQLTLACTHNEKVEELLDPKFPVTILPTDVTPANIGEVAAQIKLWSISPFKINDSNIVIAAYGSHEPGASYVSIVAGFGSGRKKTDNAIIRLDPYEQNEAVGGWNTLKNVSWNMQEKSLTFTIQKTSTKEDASANGCQVTEKYFFADKIGATSVRELVQRRQILSSTCR